MRSLPSSKPLAVALLGALALLASACGSDSPGGADYGPLAVVEGVGDPLIGSEDLGTIHIGERCVRMTLSNGEERLLIWSASAVRWDSDLREITFSWGVAGEPDAKRTTIRDGDILAIRGSAAGNGNELLRVGSLTWPATPNPDCSGAWWLVYEVKKP